MRTESENTYIWKFDSNISVVCPSCQKEAIVNKLQEKQFSERKCVCSNCGFAKTWNGKSLTYFWHESKMVDPAFNLPLFFQTTFKNKNLWAFNREHISFLEKWIAAEVREKYERDHQYHGSLESTLPKWMTSRKNRGDILKALNKLKNKT